MKKQADKRDVFYNVPAAADIPDRMQFRGVCAHCRKYFVPAEQEAPFTCATCGEPFGSRPTLRPFAFDGDSGSRDYTE